MKKKSDNLGGIFWTHTVRVIIHPRRRSRLCDTAGMSVSVFMCVSLLRTDLNKTFTVGSGRGTISISLSTCHLRLRTQI